MVNLLEALYVVTAVSGVVTLVLLWRERGRRRSAGGRLVAPRWAAITIVLATLCVTLYWYLGRTQ